MALGGAALARLSALLTALRLWAPQNGAPIHGSLITAYDWHLMIHTHAMSSPSFVIGDLFSFQFPSYPGASLPGSPFQSCRSFFLFLSLSLPQLDPACSTFFPLFSLCLSLPKPCCKADFALPICRSNLYLITP